MLVVMARRYEDTVRLLWYISSYVDWTYGDPLFGLRNSCIWCCLVGGAAVLLGVSEWMLLSKVTNRDPSLSIIGDLALMIR